MEAEKLTLDVDQSIDIGAPVERVFDELLRRLSTENTRPDGVPMPMKLEPYPGGRWFRDLGSETGHLWGFVQVIKPPTLLEICGPLFMSYPVAGHIQFRLSDVQGRTQLRLRHQAFGCIDDDHREHVVPGWRHLLETVRGALE